jgi:hypothetical protein
MLRKVFNDETTWYNRDTDRLVTERDDLMFFGVTAKQSDNVKLELELGYQPTCYTEDIDSILQLEAEADSPRSQKYKVDPRQRL